MIASHDVAGFIAPGEGRADLYVPLDALVVDEPALRSEIGLDTQPSAADIEGTRRNMLEKVLETDRYPYATDRRERRTRPAAALSRCGSPSHCTEPPDRSTHRCNSEEPPKK